MAPLKWLLPFIFVILANLLNLIWVQPTCINNANYMSNTTYKTNLESLFSLLPTHVDINGFYNTSVGRDPDTVYGSVLCRGDIQLDVCRTCIQKASTEIIKECPNQKEAFFFEDLCTLRFSPESMFGILATYPSAFLGNPRNASNPQLFDKNLGMLLNDVRGQAASGGSLRKVAAKNMTSTDSQTIFMMVQCTPDLSPVDCTNCLIGAELDIGTSLCAGKIGCRVLKANCVIHFEDNAFYDETRLEELQVLVGEPSPQPLQPLSPSSPSLLGYFGICREKRR